MSNSISNDSIWGKLSEMNQKLEKISNDRQVTQPANSLSKENVITLLNEHYQELEKLLDFQHKENLESLVEIKALQPKEEMIGLKPFLFRKTSLIMALLGALIFTLTIFCMKQQNDYAILQSRFSWQSSAIRQLQIENDSLKVKNVPLPNKKKK